MIKNKVGLSKLELGNQKSNWVIKRRVDDQNSSYMIKTRVGQSKRELDGHKSSWTIKTSVG